MRSGQANNCQYKYNLVTSGSPHLRGSAGGGGDVVDRIRDCFPRSNQRDKNFKNSGSDCIILLKSLNTVLLVVKSKRQGPGENEVSDRTLGRSL